MLRYLMIILAAMLLFPVMAGATDYSAKKKPLAKKAKVEYMRAAPMK
jgi:hypothetical protein